MSTILTQQITANEFRNMYFDEEENAHLYELMEGEIIRRGGAATLHQSISRNLLFAIETFNREKQLGTIFYAPIDVILDNYNLFQPDLVFVGNWQKEIITPKYINGSPDLVVEIISPSSVIRDRINKKQVYERTSVKEYWLVSPEYAEIEIFVLENGKYQLHSAATADEGTLKSVVLKDIELDLKSLFAV